MKKLSIEIKWAVIFTIMMICWMAMEKLLGFHSNRISQHATVTNFVAIPAILVYVLALLDKRKKNYGGYMTYKQGFISGLVITLFVTILSPLVQYLTTTFISPEYFPNMINYAVSTGEMTQPQAEAFFNLKSYLLQVILFTPVMGIATTAIVALFTKRTKKNTSLAKHNVGQTVAESY